VWSGHLPSWADFITTTPELKFGTHTHHILVPPEAEPPPFGDINKVLALFRDERLQEWATEWPSFGDDPQTVRATAIRLARAGRPEDLIRLVEALSKPPPVVKRGRGRPKMSRSARVQASPIHRAAGMVPFTEFILRELYPKQSEKRIHDRAILVVERIWRDERVTEEKLINYLDRHRGDRRRLVYSPFIFDFHEQQIVPAESVYAVFEAKQTINATLVQYAQKKTATVRNLYRTSLAIPTANGMAPPKKPGHIIGGILTFESDWKPALGAPLLAALKQGTGMLI
jgi:hypothetical protein